jgi:hypothetical protein
LGGQKLAGEFNRHACLGGDLPMTTARSNHEIVFQVQAHHRLHLVPKVRRFLSAYVEADVAARAEFRNVVANATHRLIFDPSTTATLKDDLAAAAAISRRAAYIALAHICEEVDEARSRSLDPSLIKGTYATIALVYRYVIGSYVGDPMLSGLAEAALEFVLSAEGEYNSRLCVDQHLASPPLSCNKLEFHDETSENIPAVSSQDGRNRTMFGPILRPIKDGLLLTA